MAQAEALLAGSASNHWWNTDIDVEAVMTAGRYQRELARRGIAALRIPS
jgi:hypothetical protein